MNEKLILIIVFESVALIVATIFAIKLTKKTKYFEKRFAAVIDADKELEQTKKERREALSNIENLRSSYKEKK